MSTEEQRGLEALRDGSVRDLLTERGYDLDEVGRSAARLQDLGATIEEAFLLGLTLGSHHPGHVPPAMVIALVDEVAESVRSPLTRRRPRRRPGR